MRTLAPVSRRATLAVYSAVLLIVSLVTPASGQFVIGVPSGAISQVYAEQRATQWCWAASIEMVMNFYGVSVSQEDVVLRSYGYMPDGNLPDLAGNAELITANLDGWGIDREGDTYAVSCLMAWGDMVPFALWAALDEGRPVIIGYNTGAEVGHAVVVTAMTYEGTFEDGTFRVLSITVRDPWPGVGRREYPGEFLANVWAAWTVFASEE